MSYSSSTEYEHNMLIPYTKRITGTTETNIFLCPYGQNIRFKLLKLVLYNEAGTATVVKIFDHNAVTAVTDPPATGDATTPQISISVPPTAAGSTGVYTLDINAASEINFRQGMAVVSAASGIQVLAIVREA
jgi:hypothetical protein